jgi:antirestriction protein ArdC
MSASGQDKIYALITERMIAQLKKDIIPWRKPWGAGPGQEWPRNIRSKKNYRGINVFLLTTTPYRSPWWGTYDQLAEVSGMEKVSDRSRRGYHWESPDGTPRGVRPGETSETIIFWKRFRRNEIDPSTGERTREFSAVLRYYRVFNTEQVDGLPAQYDPPELPETDESAVLASAQQVLDDYLARDNAPGFSEDGGNRAYYGLERDDNIHLPARAAFPDPNEYYSTGFHEITHSTGHPKRCNRPGVRDFDHFGSDKYSKEELVAEMGAAMLMATAGIATTATFENSAAYIRSWLSKLQDDPKLVVGAAAQAQHAADYILGVTYDNDDESD